MTAALLAIIVTAALEAMLYLYGKARGII